MARILIVEDQKIMQKYFEYIIMQEPEFRHVQTVSDAREAVKICGYSAIDLVIMDVRFIIMMGSVPEKRSGRSIHIQRY